MKRNILKVLSIALTVCVLYTCAVGLGMKAGIGTKNNNVAIDIDIINPPVAPISKSLAIDIDIINPPVAPVSKYLAIDIDIINPPVAPVSKNLAIDIDIINPPVAPVIQLKA